MPDEPDDPDAPDVLAAPPPVEVQPRRDPDDDLPVVARLVVEIRSDGRRTVARGALEDTTAGEKVAVVARGNSPLELAIGLARTMFQLPRLGRATVRALLPGRKRR